MKHNGAHLIHLRTGMMLSVCLLFALPAAPAQQSSPPARDWRGAVSGTATIEGQVIDGQTGAAIPRARVRLLGNASNAPAMLTDVNGTFLFTSLRAGDYAFLVEKPTYVSARYPEMRRTLRGQTRMVSLKDGQSVKGVNVPIYRGGSIAGRVIDAYGDPVAAAQVRAIRVEGIGSQGPASRTNDIGEFRLGSLESGQYVLVVEPGGVPQTESGISGSMPVPTFYPSVPSRDQAQPIALKRGAAVAGFDITILESERSTITGSVVSSNGQFVSQGSIVALTVERDQSGGSWIAGSAQIGADGTFRLAVPPGIYDLQASNVPSAAVSSAGAPSNQPQQFGTIRVTVAGNVSGVVVSVGQGSRATGLVRFEGTNAPAPADVARRLGQVTFVSPNGTFCRAAESRMTEALAFTVEGIVGTCVLRLNGSIENWYVRSAFYNGMNLLDQPITFSPGQQLAGIDVVLSDRRSELRVAAIDEHGQPTRDYAALIFSTDSSRWGEGSRYIRSYVPQNDASVDMIAGLPSGEYFAVALDDIELNVLRNPTFLEKLALSATRFTLRSDGKLTVQVKRIKNPFGSQ